MVQPDVDEAGRRQLRVGGGEHGQLGLGLAEAAPRVVEDPLGGLEPGHVRVAEDRQPVGRQGEDVVDRPGERLGRLQRQPVDQVDVDRIESRVAEPGDGADVELVRLPAVHRELHIRVGVLHADRGAVGADHLQGLDVVRGQPPGVDLDAELAVDVEAEVLVDHHAQPGELLGGEEGGRSPAEVHLGDRPPAVHARGHLRHLERQVVHVLATAASWRLVTIVLQPQYQHWLLAERKVEIERHRARARRRCRPRSPSQVLTVHVLD